MGLESGWEKALQEGAALLGVRLEAGALPRLASYLKELSRWNRKINLVSRESKEEEWAERHLLDSLVPLGMGLLGKEAGPILDLGAGAGFPGLALKAAASPLDLYLAEADARKCSFLRHLIRTLHLERAVVLQARFEELRLPAARDLYPGLRKVEDAGGFGVVVSRAAAQPEEARELALSFLRPGGRALLWVSAVPRGTADRVHPYTLPFSKREGIIWEVRKG